MKSVAQMVSFFESTSKNVKPKKHVKSPPKLIIPVQMKQRIIMPKGGIPKDYYASSSSQNPRPKSPRKPFKLKKFLKSVSKDDHLFYEKFIETQLFNDYILKRMTPKDKDEQTEVLYFEEKIFLLNNENDKIVFLNSNLFNIKNEYKVPKINSNIDEEILHFYINEQNLKNF